MLESYFHRELPFDFELIEKLQPRLKNARKLIEEKKVRIEKQQQNVIEAFVAGRNVEHRVQILAGEAKCTCPWYAKHQGQRGPCKHVLAAQLYLEDDGQG